MKAKTIKVWRSKYSPKETDAEYKFIQWISNEETVIAIVEDFKTGQILQFRLDRYVMNFTK